MSVPLDAQERKGIPLASGVLDYFPDALLEVARVSRAGNEQHHPGQPLHWDKGKSTDEADALMRHLVDRGKRDKDGMRHSAKVAWRALALLQREIEAERAEGQDTSGAELGEYDRGYRPPPPAEGLTYSPGSYQRYSLDDAHPARPGLHPRFRACGAFRHGFTCTLQEHHTGQHAAKDMVGGTLLSWD